ncbi:MAG: tetratricopeptide repeat protein [Elusimicrobiota bacterium]
MTDSRVGRRKKSGLAILTFFVFTTGASAITLGQIALIDDHYFNRDKGNNLDTSISELNDQIKENETAPLYWRRCRSLMRRGEKRDKKSDKLADYEAARADCEKSVALEPSSADAHFWYGVVMGRWGETKGILKALFLIKPIRQQMNETLKLDPKHGGAHRVLGEILWQVPGFAGGDKKRALAEFEAAVRLSPNHSANYEPLTEAYLYYGRKNDAAKTLKALAEIKDADDPAEFLNDLADGQKLMHKLGPK